METLDLRDMPINTRLKELIDLLNEYTMALKRTPSVYLIDEAQQRTVDAGINRHVERLKDELRIKKRKLLSNPKARLKRDEFPSSDLLPIFNGVKVTSQRFNGEGNE